jgi:hypothetical protein
MASIDKGMQMSGRNMRQSGTPASDPAERAGHAAQFKNAEGAVIADCSSAALTLQRFQQIAEGVPLRAAPKTAGRASKTLQRVQQLANGSPQALQFRRQAETMAAATAATSMQTMPPSGAVSATPTNVPVQREKKANDTGLPDQLKSGIESLSGMSLDHVKVQYNSAQPAQLDAHAYAQGSDIHVAPGQERHLPHEAWHVVQQAQGRVQPTMQAKGQAINNDGGLEHEADVMGARALAASAVGASTQAFASPSPAGRAHSIQRVMGIGVGDRVVVAWTWPGVVTAVTGESYSIRRDSDNTTIDNVPEADVAPAPDFADDFPEVAEVAEVADVVAPALPIHDVQVAIGAHATHNGVTMYTEGLANCIAVVAYNAGNGMACLYHYNTFASFENDEENGVEDEEGDMVYPAIASADAILENKAIIDAALGSAATEYHIVLGGLWRDDGPMKQSLVAALTAHFHPTTLDQTGFTKARWNTPTLTGYN